MIIKRPKYSLIIPFNKLILYVIYICTTLSFSPLGAQTRIDHFVDSVKMYNQRLSLEKLYVQTDRIEYMTGDTLWFKSYLFDPVLNYSSKSGLLYVDIVSDSNQVVKQMMLPVVTGITWGNIALDQANFKDGIYTLRAYTNWMRNFGEDYVFMKKILISKPGRDSWLVQSDLKASKLDGKEQGTLRLHFGDLNNRNIGLRQMRMSVRDGRRTLYNQVMETSLYGQATIDFDIPDKTDPSSLYLVAQDLRNGEGNRVITFPLTLNRPEKADLQFMPEGGTIVAGLPSEVGFKAVAEDGRGADISGKIFDSKQQEVSSFHSSHKGMGSFLLEPRAGESYHARVDLPSGGFIDYPLPEAGSSGTTLRVVNRRGAESLEVIIQASPDLTGSSYHLIGQSNGLVHYGATVLLKQALTRVLIDKTLFPTGVACITLLNNSGTPLNERRVFISRDEEGLDLVIHTDKDSYSSRDSIAVELTVTDHTGQPVTGSFSLAVTDDSRVRTDSLGRNIINYIYLSSALQGTVEDPDYYFRAVDTAKAWLDLDRLLLTQGWVRYNWQKVFKKPDSIAFRAEPEFTIGGSVIDVFNKPVANTGLVLFSKRPLVMTDTLTNDQGEFTFRDLPMTDSATYIIQARNRRGKSVNVDIRVNEFSPPLFTQSSERYKPWYLNSDTLQLESTKEIVEEIYHHDAPAGMNVLEEVMVTATKIIKDSHNKNGSGNADYILDEKDMQEAKRKTLYEVLKERFPDLITGKGQAVQDLTSDTMRYVLLNRYIYLVIDGVDIHEIGSVEENYMDYLTAADITGIEIMSSAKYGLTYDEKIIKRLARCPSKGKLFPCPPPPIFMEVTTRSGNGAFIRKTPGVYLYRPLAYNFPDEFYRPRYLVREEKPALPDLRSTIHWEPNIITDEQGKARISFYSADQKGSYTLIFEGADMTGRIGFKRRKIIIEGGG